MSRTIIENDRMRQIRIFCAIFGYKFILKLLRPLNISLNPRLERINNVVKEEIHEVLRYKNISNQKQGKNKDHLDEIARKITLWAVNILEETDNKLLEEELRELEEEEGPVLDLIDSLIERVMVS
ncbi:unnamed protein product [Parnassius mnemosyne]|uniref:Uncharacterized protein n=1 Tax=Parnassius mnemosyne TaxID=213953 RepID=A0AAV1M7K1_9NEOP